MSDLERVTAWLDSGRLVRPSADVVNFVDLVRALMRLGGADDVPGGPGVETLTTQIGRADHYVLILVDGMGMNLLEALPDDAFLRKGLVGEIRSVFLSATASALTTLATAEWPAVHGVPGWWAYLDEFDVSAVTLPFAERTTTRPLAELGITPERVFPVPSIWPKLRADLLTVYPRRLTETVYSHYASGGTLRAGYDDLREAVALTLRRVQGLREPSFTYVYFPQVDEAAHHHGTRDGRVRELLLSLDRLFSDLARTLAGRARLIITSDHGLADVPPARRFVLPGDDPVAAHLVCPPTGEPTVPIFHVLEGHEEAFLGEFTERFGDAFALLTVDEVEARRLLGPGELSPTTRRRLGTFVGIADEPAKFYVEPCPGSVRHIGVHGGLTADEMRIPLVLA